MSADTKLETRAPNILTIKEAAAEVKLSPDTLWKAIKSNQLSVKWPSPTKALVKFEELMRWFDSLPDEKPERVA